MQPCRHLVREVLDGGLGHAVHEGAVRYRADDAQWRLIAHVDRQLGPVRSHRCNLEVGFKTWEEARVSAVTPLDRDHCRVSQCHRRTQLDVHSALNSMMTEIQPDRG